MARENRRKREERRFGRPERLADIILDRPPERWLLSPFVHAHLVAHPADGQAVGKAILDLQQKVARAAIIRADNVASFYFDHPKWDWNYHTDFPCSAPPFESFFIECRTPPSMVIEGGERRPTAGMPSCFGWLFRADEAKDFGQNFPCVDVAGRVDYRRIEGARWFVDVDLVTARDGHPCFMGAARAMAIGESGEMLVDPPSMIQGETGLSGVQKEGLHASIGLFFVPALLAVSFMNCKNVTLEAHDPDPLVNRERRRNGHKPFLRYHTINIEPMKAVLRTEGNIESEGLRRALHICRGHFATYTADKPLFGRTVGTVWRPSHVRGHASEGVVVSDYNVDPTKN
jgi:hypothetical protein